MVNEPSNVLQIQAGNRGQPCSLLDLTAEEHNAYRQEAQRQYVVQAPQLEPKSLAVTARSNCRSVPPNSLSTPTNNVHPATKQLDGQMQPTSLPSSSTPPYAAKQLDDTVSNIHTQPLD